MAEATIMRQIDVGAAYQPLAATRSPFTGDISCEPGNAGTVYFKGDDGSDVPWVPGEWHHFVNVDLAEIEIKGTGGDAVTVIGGTW